MRAVGHYRPLLLFTCHSPDSIFTQLINRTICRAWLHHVWYVLRITFSWRHIVSPHQPLNPLSIILNP